MTNSSELDDCLAEVRAHRDALDAILALVGHDPYVAECYNDPHFGETVRQAVEEALGGAPECSVRRYLVILEGLLAARACTGGLSPEAEAEFTEVRLNIWRGLLDHERVILHRPSGLIEKAKARWGGPDSGRGENRTRGGE